jgi:hypothetical protein
MRNIIVLVVGLLLPTALMAQLDQAWVSTYSVPYGQNEGWWEEVPSPASFGSYSQGNDIVVDDDGYVYACGAGTGPYLSVDFLTIKYDPATGETLWVRYYNGPANDADTAVAIAVDNAGGVYVTGKIFISGYAAKTWNDYATVKYDASDGHQVWDARYSDTGKACCGATAITVNDAGGVYVTGAIRTPGASDADIVTVKYDADDGSQEWVAHYNSPEDKADNATALAVDSTGGVYVTGSCATGYSGLQYVTIKYDATTGTDSWITRHDGYGVANAIAVDNAGGVYVTGTELVTIKYDAASGTEDWVSPSHTLSQAKAIALDESGGVYVTGVSNEGPYSYYGTTVKFDPADGSELWFARFPSSVYGAMACAVDNTDGIYVTGVGDDGGHIATVRYDATTGSEIWNVHYIGRYSSDRPRAVAVDNAGGVYVAGLNAGIREMLTLKYRSADGSQAWVSMFHNENLSAEAGSRIACDKDGYAYACGWANGPDSTWDFITVKYNPATGETLWVRYYDSEDNSYEGGGDFGVAIAVDSAGGVYVTGGIADTARYKRFDMATIKYNAADGSEAWVVRYDGTAHLNDFPLDVECDDAGGVYVVGRTNAHPDIHGGSQCVTVKYNSADGSQAWAVTYDYPDLRDYQEDFLEDVVIDKSGGVYVSGNYQWMDDYASGVGFLTIKYNAVDGGQEWIAFHKDPDPAYPFEEQSGLAADNAGGVYVGGWTGNDRRGLVSDYTVVKYNASSGSEVWTAHYDGPGGRADEARDLAVDGLGGVYVTGTSWGSGTSSYDYATVKYDASDGKEVWVARYNGNASGTDVAYAIVADDSRGVCVTGYSTGAGTGADYTTVAYDPETGSQTDVASYGGSLNLDDVALSIASDRKGGIYVTGFCMNVGTAEDIVTIKYGGSILDAGVAEILEPSGTIDTLSETPVASVHNFGTVACDVTAWFEIRDAATNTVRYLQSATVTDLAARTEVSVTFPEWDVPNDLEGLYYAKSWTVLEGDANAGNDTARNEFTVEGQQQEPSAWLRWTDVPEGPQNRVVQHGGSLATDPEGRYVFLLKGDNTDEFYRFDPATSTWTTLDAIPDRGRDNVPRNVKEGGTLAQVGGRFYATKGGNSLEFWEYNPAAAAGSRWTQRADVPAGDATIHDGASATGVGIGTSNYVYFLKGSTTCEFYRYNVASDEWQEMAAAPGEPGDEFKIGSSISFDGIDTVFALKGIANKFYAYSVATNTWSEKEELPLGENNKQAKGGAAVCYHLRKVYCVKGSNSQEFWVFDCNTGHWGQGPDMPLGEHKTRVQDGGGLVYCRESQYLFGTKGNCNELWSYGKLSNSGPMAQEGQPVGLSGRYTPYRLEATPTVVTGKANIAYALPEAGNVELALYDASGRLAKTLAHGESQPGEHTALLAASGLARGVYVLRYRSGEFKAARKLVIQ